VEAFLCFVHVLQYTSELWVGVANRVDWKVMGAYCWPRPPRDQESMNIVNMHGAGPLSERLQLHHLPPSDAHLFRGCVPFVVTFSGVPTDKIARCRILVFCHLRDS
jgi:hypothetical protein